MSGNLLHDRGLDALGGLIEQHHRRLADRGLVMDKGRIVARLDGSEIRSRDVVKRFLAL